MKITEIFNIDDELLIIEKLKYSNIVKDTVNMYRWIEQDSNKFMAIASEIYDSDDRGKLYSQCNMLSSLALEYLGSDSQSYKMSKRLCEYLGI